MQQGRSEGGVFQELLKGYSTTAFSYLSHSAVVIHCESAPTLPTREKGGDESDPPQKRGGHVTLNRRAVGHASIRLHGVALVLIYPCGKARNSPQERR